MDPLESRTAVITGAASGIGLGIARACARAGMRVALLDIQEAPLRAAARELAAAGTEVLAVAATVATGLSAVLEGGADPDAVGEQALRAMRDRRFFIFTDPEHREWISARHTELIEAFDPA